MKSFLTYIVEAEAFKKQRRLNALLNHFGKKLGLPKSGRIIAAADIARHTLAGKPSFSDSGIGKDIMTAASAKVKRNTNLLRSFGGDQRALSDYKIVARGLGILDPRISTERRLQDKIDSRLNRLTKNGGMLGFASDPAKWKALFHDLNPEQQN